VVANVRNGYTKYVADKVGWPVNWWPTLTVGWAHAPGSGFLTPAHSLCSPQALKTTPLAHPHHLHFIFPIPASSTRSRFRLIVIPSQNGSVRSLQQAPPAPGRGRTGYNRKERSSSVAAPLTPILRRPVSLGLSSLPSSSTQCLSSRSASTPRWRPTVSRAKTPKLS
jgi:hypothetical protein